MVKWAVRDYTNTDNPTCIIADNIDNALLFMKAYMTQDNDCFVPNQLALSRIETDD
jgi:hypothetical protein